MHTTSRSYRAPMANSTFEWNHIWLPRYYVLKENVEIEGASLIFIAIAIIILKKKENPVGC